MNFDKYTAKIMESTTNRGTWKVWIHGPFSSGYISGGFAWKTRVGAETFTNKMYPGINFIS